MSILLLNEVKECFAWFINITAITSKHPLTAKYMQLPWLRETHSPQAWITVHIYKHTKFKGWKSQKSKQSSLKTQLWLSYFDSQQYCLSRNWRERHITLDLSLHTMLLRAAGEIPTNRGTLVIMSLCMYMAMSRCRAEDTSSRNPDRSNSTLYHRYS